MIALGNINVEFHRFEIFKRFYDDLCKLNNEGFKNEVYRLSFSCNDGSTRSPNFHGYGSMFKHLGQSGDFIISGNIPPKELKLPNYEETNPDTSPYFIKSCIADFEKVSSYEAIRVESQKVTSCSQITVHYIYEGA